MPETFEEIWRAHENSAFPASCKDRRIAGVSLEELDSELSSCIRTILDSDSLNREGQIVLAVSLDKLSKVTPSLHEPAKSYFVRLRTLAHLIIEARA